jgi:hypothetical protein
MIYIIFKLLHNLFDLCQVSLSKMAKHWDSFLSDCRWVGIENRMSNVGVRRMSTSVPDAADSTAPHTCSLVTHGLIRYSRAVVGAMADGLGGRGDTTKEGGVRRYPGTKWRVS